MGKGIKPQIQEFQKTPSKIKYPYPTGKKKKKKYLEIAYEVLKIKIKRKCEGSYREKRPTAQRTKELQQLFIRNMQARGHLVLTMPLVQGGALTHHFTHQGREVVSPTPAETTAHRAYAIFQGHPGGKQQSCIQTQDFPAPKPDS